MKKFLFLTLLSLILVLYVGIKSANAQPADYDQIYNNLPVVDFHYDHNEDPDELMDYSQFVVSPYPLVRISDSLVSKTIKLKPGYYLLSPKSREGYDFIMFKQKGRIVGMIPVFDKQIVDPKLIFPTPPKPKVGFWKGMVNGVKAGFHRLFGKYENPPKMPRCKLSTNYVNGGKYLEFTLIREENLYKILLKVAN